jgi:hydrogenase maturation protein HypF
MVADLQQAKALCEVSEFEAEQLSSPRRPIVLLKRRLMSPLGIAPEISHESPFLGVMLPYTPLHFLIFQELGSIPIVMTSGNGSDRPMVRDEKGALEELKAIADLYLIHDRPIRVRCDDSVVRVVEPLSIPLLMRRGRGYAPEPIGLVTTAGSPILGVGAFLKNTFALIRGRQAVLSHHIGDLDELSTFEAFKSEIAHYESLLEIRPECIAHDLHPDYLSTVYARERASHEGLKSVGVQHHHAHLASCMADNGLDGTEKVIGVTFDGTGYGTDGKIWGGEFLIGDYEGFERAAHLRYVPMAGGDQAVREPWRMAIAYTIQAGLEPELPSKKAMQVPPDHLKNVVRMLERRVNSRETSSVGRLFDAVAALVGVRERVSFEGQAAMELEAWAMRGQCGTEGRTESWPEGWIDEEIEANRCVSPRIPIVLDVAPWIRSIVAELRQGVSGPELASRFHINLVGLIVRVCCELRARHGIDRVALSGGVFMNGIILSGACLSLRKQGFQVLCHKRVPPNDGGISLGQIAVAAAILKRGGTHVLGDSREGG